MADADSLLKEQERLLVALAAEEEAARRAVVRVREQLLQNQIHEIETTRAPLAAQGLPLSPAHESSLASLRQQVQQLSSVAVEEYMYSIEQRNRLHALGCECTVVEQRLRPLLADHFTRRRRDAEAQLADALAHAEAELASASECVAQLDLDAVLAVQERVRSCAQQVASAERAALEASLGLRALIHRQVQLQTHKTCPSHHSSNYSCGFNGTQYSPCRVQFTREAEEATIQLLAAQRTLADRAADDERSLMQLQAAHDEQLARLRQQHAEVRAAQAAAAAAAAAPRRHPTAATVAASSAALQDAARACDAALAAATAEADAYAPSIARARAKLAEVERQRDAALAARGRVEAGLAAVTAALAGADGMGREVAVLLDERDAARAETVTVRAAAARAAEAHAAEAAALQRRLAAAEAATSREVARADGLEALLRGTGERQRAAVASLSAVELAALPGHLYRALDVAAKVAAERAAAAAAPRQAQCAVCLDAPSDTVLLPCGHKCACRGCAVTLTRGGGGPERRACPICRAPLTGSVVPFEC
jgi:hypothetical protein